MTGPSITRSRVARTLALLAILGVAPRLVTAIALLRAMIAPPRQPIRRTPADVGLSYEPVAFRTQDAVALRGWFIPGKTEGGSPGPAVVILHGWPWNRVGNDARHALAPGLPNQPVDLLAPVAALQAAGSHVLMFDLRNHGTSGAKRPVTFGQRETEDLAAAIRWLRGRPDVDGRRLGLLGFSMGANTALLGIPPLQPITAAALIQPVQPVTFARNLTRMLFGPFASAMLRQSEWLYRLAGGPALAEIDLIDAAAHLGTTALLYVQGTGDPWGTVSDVQRMAQRTPGPTEIVLPETSDRYGGYQWTARQSADLVRFFQQHLRE